MKTLTLFICGLLLASGTPEAFNKHWYSGKAEVAVYDLQQSRYGILRPGTATLIFVVEPFSKGKHVKLDNPSAEGKDKAMVLKLNTSKKYNTGIYPYSVMTSAFSDVESGQLYKTTTSIQEWCGHVFSQANVDKKGNYDYQSFSYFESSGDQEMTFEGASLAEELILKIRLNKLDQDTKKMMIVPPQEALRNHHLPAKKVAAELNWSEGAKTRTLTVTYDLPNKLETTITYEKDFPYEIQNWTESFDQGGKRNTTSATLKTIQMIPYWSMNSPEFAGKRKEIGLE